MGGVRNSSSAKAPRVVKKAAVPVRAAAPVVSAPRNERRLVRACSGWVIAVVSGRGRVARGGTTGRDRGPAAEGGPDFGSGYFAARRRGSPPCPGHPAVGLIAPPGARRARTPHDLARGWWRGVVGGWWLEGVQI